MGKMRKKRMRHKTGNKIWALVQEQMRVGDWMVIGGILLLAAALTLFLLYGARSSPAGIAVEIWQDNELVYTAPLTNDTDALIPVTSEHGQNQIRLHGLTAQIASADCSDQVCVRTGALTRIGQTAVCLPHRVIVKLVRDEPEISPPDGVDGVDKDGVDTEDFDAVAS